jgi:predicted house-cleaning NTP pyrophosphatase (Maf/HAM1 superfamily)
LQADIVDISTGEEQARQENPTLQAPENPATTVDTLVNLQDPILETPENLAMTVDTLANLQDLQEPIVTSSAINPSQEKVCYISKLFASFFPYTILIFCLLSGLEPLGGALI